MGISRRNFIKLLVLAPLEVVTRDVFAQNPIETVDMKLHLSPEAMAGMFIEHFFTHPSDGKYDLGAYVFSDANYQDTLQSQESSYTYTNGNFFEANEIPTAPAPNLVTLLIETFKNSQLHNSQGGHADSREQLIQGSANNAEIMDLLENIRAREFSDSPIFLDYHKQLLFALPNQTSITVADPAQPEQNDLAKYQEFFHFETMEDNPMNLAAGNNAIVSGNIRIEIPGALIDPERYQDKQTLFVECRLTRNSTPASEALNFTFSETGEYVDAQFVAIKPELLEGLRNQIFQMSKIFPKVVQFSEEKHIPSPLGGPSA